MPTPRTTPGPKSRRKTPELVIITGLSGSGKGTVLRCMEDLGYYAVDNLPIDLLPTFAKLVKEASGIGRTAMVVDVREGEALKRFPKMFRSLKMSLPVSLLFLEADTDSLLRRFSESRRPHPLGSRRSMVSNLRVERDRLSDIRALADHTIDTTDFTVHELRRQIEEKFSAPREESKMVIYVSSFGFRNGIPADADTIFDVRFLPNPNYVPKLKPLTGKDKPVADFLWKQPATEEFLDRVADLLFYLVPKYMHEGKSYLTIAFGCTGGHHRSVFIADEIQKRLAGAGFQARGSHRDIRRPF